MLHAARWKYRTQKIAILAPSHNFVVNGHKSVAHTDSSDGGIGKTCLGGGMHYPSASLPSTDKARGYSVSAIMWGKV